MKKILYALGVVGLIGFSGCCKERTNCCNKHTNQKCEIQRDTKGHCARCHHKVKYCKCLNNCA